MSNRPKRDHIAMMKHPGEWPRWPVLPLVNRSDDSTNLLQSRAGILFAAEEHTYTVVLRNIFELEPGRIGEMIETDLANGQAVSYTSFEDIYDAGWRVD
jgi:hypothetical protein